ncbi:MAG: methytransferase partner Trm112 [Candidatus Thermoplasmatota archaeon]|nr:methytransferase partner Trm112 [Candidatus Thermoplasmatota archaeon]
MRKEIIKILCCPVCKTDLTVSIEKEEDNDIITGTLTCNSCHTVYPIKDGIPDLLPPENPEG